MPLDQPYICQIAVPNERSTKMNGLPQKMVRSMILPFTRAGLPAGAVLRRLKLAYLVRPDPWAGEATVVAPRRDGGRMRLDLDEWTDRIAWFTGRYYERHTEDVLSALLKKGDCVLDIGANNGLLAIHAARLVGPGGIVDCFEPNPQMAGRVREQIELNGLKNVILREFALGALEGDATLCVPNGFPGTGSLSAANGLRAEQITEHCVAVRRADDVLAGRNRLIKLVKIDVEGHEPNVLRGMSQILQADRPFVLTECIASLLARAGSSLEDLFALMRGHGYIGYAVATVRKGLRENLRLTRLRDSATDSPAPDVLWAAGERVNELRVPDFEIVQGD